MSHEIVRTHVITKQITGPRVSINSCVEVPLSRKVKSDYLQQRIIKSKTYKMIIKKKLAMRTPQETRTPC